MATYRLVWSGDGALDLSQVLDTRGQPIVLSPQQREVSISSEVLKNPYLQRYLATPQLKAEPLDGSKTAPLPTPPSPPTPVPPIVKTTPVAPMPTALEPPKSAAVAPEPIMIKEALTVEPSSAEPPSPSTPPASSGTEAKTELKGGIKSKGGRK